jgi:hypothetical protein
MMAGKPTYQNGVICSGQGSATHHRDLPTQLFPKGTKKCRENIRGISIYV